MVTPSDFGTQGEKPTHPELLDWLAGELIRGGWRLKPLHKLIMSSAGYQQAPLNTQHSTLNIPSRRRLEAEVIRDSILAVTGTLDRTMFGPGSLDAGMKRRSIYFQIKRSALPPMLVTFDAPDTLGSLGQRASTTVAPQALLLMNNGQVRASARGWAKRLVSLEAADAVRSAYLTAFGRAPDEQELANATDFVASQTGSYSAAGKPESSELALTDFCQTLMSLNEFVYVE